MTAWILAISAACITLRLTGFRRMWPWRLAALPTEQRTHAGAVTVHGGRGVDRTVTRRGRRLNRVGRSPRTRLRGGSSRLDDARLLRSLPLTTDLLLVATSAGHSIHSAIDVVRRFDHGPSGVALSDAWSRFSGGSRLVDELRRLPGIHGDVMRPLVDTLVMGVSSGAPLEPALHRLADRQRQMIRRRTEERVRRLPILLLGPLVLFVLPSFVVLAILPVVMVTAKGAGF